MEHDGDVADSRGCCHIHILMNGTYDVNTRERLEKCLRTYLDS